jgi:NAD(P)-dependent dehydrogenase (short-subunit alcohol dehydrogenase family)
LKIYVRPEGAANLAGIFGHSYGLQPITDIDDGEWDVVIGVNLTSMMHCLQA